MSSDNEKILKKWVLKRRKKGLSDTEIRADLLRKGYVSFLVERVLIETRYSSGRKKYIAPFLYVFGAIIVLLLASSVVLMIMNASCNSEKCFIANANDCEIADFEKSVEGSQFEFSTEGLGKSPIAELYEFSTESCIVTKKLISLGGADQNIKDLLEGESMTCYYEKENFDEELFNSVTSGIENCEGALKDGLQELVDVFS
ncbi:hypothetical protein ACFLZZ_02490 [Nanoarchaeota archaeon]